MNNRKQEIHRESHKPADPLFTSKNKNDRHLPLQPPAARISMTARSKATSSKKKKENFPFVLMHMLQTIEMEEPELADIVSWNPDGTSFQIHDKTRFENEIQHRFFKQNSYSSFRRQLNIWGFKAIGDRKTKETTALYGHPMFLRDNPKLCYAIARKGVKGSLSDLYPQMQYDYSASRSNSFNTGFSRRSSTRSESISVPSAKSSTQNETRQEEAKSSKSEPYQFYDKIPLQKEKSVQLFQDPAAKSEGKDPDLSSYEMNFPTTSFHQQHEARLEDSRAAVRQSSFSKYPLLPQNIQSQKSTRPRQISSSFHFSDDTYSQERGEQQNNTYHSSIHSLPIELLHPQQEPMSLLPKRSTIASTTTSNIQSKEKQVLVENVLSQIQEIDKQTAQLDQQFDPSKLYQHNRRPSLFSSFSYPRLQDNSQSAAQQASFRSLQESSSDSSPFFDVKDEEIMNDEDSVSHPFNKSSNTLPTVLLDEVEPIQDEEEIKPIPPLFGDYMKQLLSSNSTHDTFRRESLNEE